MALSFKHVRDGFTELEAICKCVINCNVEEYED
jgi:hypothetical protein